MGVLAQCGFGRATKLEKGLEQGTICGAIMSPKDERPERLEGFLNSSFGKEQASAIMLFDPQFYVSSLRSPNTGQLPEYPYFGSYSNLGRADFSGTRIQEYVRGTIDYQADVLGTALSYLVSPTVAFEDFRDLWSQISLNLASESAEYCEKSECVRPLLISLVISETAFSAMDAVEEFLDALTEINTTGFYILVKRESQGIQYAMDEDRFARLMYFLYVLSEINGYEVVAGYSDLLSFLLHVAGVKYSASGWYQNLRQFSLSRFMPSSPRRRPNKRYTSSKLVACPLLNPDLENVFLAGEIEAVLSGSSYDDWMRKGPAQNEPNWTDEVACLAHWHALSQTGDAIARRSNIAERISEAESMLRRALAVHTYLHSKGIIFEAGTGVDHIHSWTASLKTFKRLIGQE